MRTFHLSSTLFIVVACLSCEKNLPNVRLADQVLAADWMQERFNSI
jgi:hypothetical protein